MTPRDFVRISNFETYELSINIIASEIRAHNLTVTDIISNEEGVFDREIKYIDFITSGDNSAESYLDITLYVE